MPSLWIDGHSYGTRLLRNGREPWLEPAELGLFCGELDALLAPDRLLLPIEPLFQGWESINDDGALCAALEAGLATIAPLPVMARLVPVLPHWSRIAATEPEDDAIDDFIDVLGDLLRVMSRFGPAGVALDAPRESGFTAGSLARVAEHLAIPLYRLDRRHFGTSTTVTLVAGLRQAEAETSDKLLILAEDADPEGVLDQLERFRAEPDAR